MIQRWEYCLVHSAGVSVDIDYCDGKPNVRENVAESDIFRKLGLEGWELTATNTDTQISNTRYVNYIFKRPR